MAGRMGTGVSCTHARRHARTTDAPSRFMGCVKIGTQVIGGDVARAAEWPEGGVWRAGRDGWCTERRQANIFPHQVQNESRSN